MINNLCTDKNGKSVRNHKCFDHTSALSFVVMLYLKPGCENGHCAKERTIHQVATMLATYKNVLFQVITTC